MNDYYEEFERLAFSTDNVGYYYLVTEFMTTFEKDKNQTKPLEVEKAFKGDNLLQCRKDAIAYYIERLVGFRKSSYFLPFASPEDFQFGKNAAFSLNLILVDVCSDRENHIVLLGDSIEENLEGQEEEALIFKKLKEGQVGVTPLQFKKDNEIEELIVELFNGRINQDNGLAAANNEPPSEDDFEFMTYVEKLQFYSELVEKHAKNKFINYLKEKIQALT